MLLLLSGSILAAALYLWHTYHYATFGESLRYTAFNFVSIGLANGLSNTDFAQW